MHAVPGIKSTDDAMTVRGAARRGQGGASVADTLLKRACRVRMFKMRAAGIPQRLRLAPRAAACRCTVNDSSTTAIRRQVLTLSPQSWLLARATSRSICCSIGRS